MYTQMLIIPLCTFPPLLTTIHSHSFCHISYCVKMMQWHALLLTCTPSLTHRGNLMVFIVSLTQFHPSVYQYSWCLTFPGNSPQRDGCGSKVFRSIYSSTPSSPTHISLPLILFHLVFPPDCTTFYNHMVLAGECWVGFVGSNAIPVNTYLFHKMGCLFGRVGKVIVDISRWWIRYIEGWR